MLKRLLTVFLAGRLLRFLSGSRRSAHHGSFRHAYPRRWGYRNQEMHDLTEMLGLHRRRRSFI